MRNNQKGSKQVDGKRLYSQLSRIGLSGSEASRRIGRAHNYIANIVNSGFVPEHTIIALESVLGIPYEDYAPLSNLADTTTQLGGVDLTETNRILTEMLEELQDIRYVANIVAKDLKEIKHELIGEESDSPLTELARKKVESTKNV